VLKRFKLWHWIAWFLAAGFAVWLYFQTFKPTSFVGLVERKSHEISSLEPGIISRLNVDIGSAVKVGQELAYVQIANVQTERNKLQILSDKLRLEKTYRDEMAGLEANKAELAGLNAQIQKLQSVQKENLVPALNLEDLIIKRDSLQKRVQEQTKLLEEQIRRDKKDSPLFKNSKEFLEKSSGKNLQESYLDAFRSKYSETEQSIDHTKIFSPCDGRVIAVNARTGDTISALKPFLEIEETVATHLEAYIPEYADVVVKEGDKVKIVPNRAPEKSYQGTVAFVHPGFSAIPDRLIYRLARPWVRRVYIQLDPSNDLLPDEKVKVSVRNNDWRDFFDDLFSSKAKGESITPDPSEKTAKLEQFHVPDRLRQITAFEPSGLLWLEDIQRYLVVSDDTGRRGINFHIPWLFLMDLNGNVESDPVVIRGINEVNDLESVTAADDGTIYLLTSQSLNKEGKRKKSRQLLLEVRRDKRDFAVSRKVEFFSLLIRAYDQNMLQQLGLAQAAAREDLILNIEGLAWREKTLYLGLKEPTGGLGAIVWRLSDLDRLFDKQELLPNQLSKFGEIDLGSLDSRRAGISDMTFDSNGRLLILSTIPHAPDSEQEGGCNLVDSFHEGMMKAKRLFSFPRLKPEGISQGPSGIFRIVFDAGEDIPFFVDVKVQNNEK